MVDYSESISCLECTNGSICFKKLIPSELEFINQKKTQVNYRKGENICKQGAIYSSVLYVVKGLVKIYLECPGNKDINVRISKPHEFIGLSGVCGDDVFNYSAQAIKDSTVCFIDKESFNQLVLSNGKFALEIIKGYCLKEKKLFNKVRSLGHKQMHGRLADTLTYLCGDNFKDENVFSYISRKDIANFACISTESVVRILSELKQEKIIAMNGKKIEILQNNLLEEISRRG